MSPRRNRIAAAAAAVAAMTLTLAPRHAAALDNGLLLTPPMGFNSWTAVGTGVTDAFLREVADFFVSSGLRAAGYNYVNTDDGWSLGQRDSVTSRLVPDPSKFPYGLANLTAYLQSQGLRFGIYSAASSVVCSGRPGSLYHEVRCIASGSARGLKQVIDCVNASLSLRRRWMRRRSRSGQSPS